MRRVIIFVFMAALCQGLALGQSQSGQPELPRVYLDTRMPVRTGIIIIVGANEDFQSELNSSKHGDTIEIASGVTKTGNFTLPAKTGPGVVLIKSTEAPAEGVRVSPGGNYAKIISPNASPAIRTLAGANGYRFVGIEIGVAGIPQNNGLVILGGGETALTDIPSNITIDRCYIHGNAAGNMTRGIALNSASTAVIDSYISDCHGVGYETQAICGWSGPGPFKIVNNYIEGSGVNFMLGGADPLIPNLVPSDVEFRRNTLSKPLSWNPNEPTYAGIHWSVKNIFELKNVQRILIDGNVFENNWVDAQSGFGAQITPRNQEGRAPWSIVSDVTLTNNIVRHSAAGINILGKDDLQTAQQAQRILIQNNLFEDIGGSRWGGNGRFLQISDSIGVTVNHNTVLHTGNVITAHGGPSTGFVYANNLSPHNDYGVMGDNSSPGNATINTYFPGSLFTKNVFVGGNPAVYPPDNFFPSTLDAVGFVDRAGGNYRLSVNSPYLNAGTDGKDVGADIGAILAAAKPPEPEPTPTPSPVPPPPPPPPADTTAPVISNFRVTSTTADGFTVAWTTNEPAVVAIEFGRTNAFGYAKAFTTSFLFSNAIVVDVLSAKSTFYFRLAARDQAGNESKSATFSVTTRPK